VAFITFSSPSSTTIPAPASLVALTGLVVTLATTSVTFALLSGRE
jgi:hypothetical protein